jgi:hypothetical protein
MPEDYAEQPGGKLGRDSLFNLFQSPFQIYGIVKQGILERARRADPKLTLQVILVYVRVVPAPTPRRPARARRTSGSRGWTSWGSRGSRSSGRRSRRTL